MTIGMIPVPGLCRQVNTVKCETGGDHIDDRLQGIGQDRPRISQVPPVKFHRTKHQTHTPREADPSNPLPVIFLHSAKDTESRSEEHTSELQSLMRISYAVFCLKK